MAEYLSADLRIRVIRAVEAGMSRNAAARRFGVASRARCSLWMSVCAPAGRAEAARGDRRSGQMRRRRSF